MPKRSWAMRLAFVIAGRELMRWRSESNRAVASLTRVITTESIIQLLEENMGFGDPEGDAYFQDAITLIEEDAKNDG